MSGAPDFVEPVVGYRGWRLGQDGRLAPLGWEGAPAWQPGINQALCQAHLLSGRRSSHAAPDSRCRCGLYALRSVRTHGLQLYRDATIRPPVAVGAIAAWGAIEAHRTGFRAQYACVLALAVHKKMTPYERATVERAGERYGVPVVQWRGPLETESLRHASPLPADLVPPPSPEDLRERRRARPARLARTQAAVSAIRRLQARSAQQRESRTGYWLDHHLWVRREGDDCTVGISQPFAALLADDVRLTRVASGCRVEQGDPIARLSDRNGEYFVFAPVSGTISELHVSQLLGQKLRDRPLDDGWLLRLRPSAWEQQTGELAWGRAGLLEYHAWLAAAGQGADVFTRVRTWARPARAAVRSWADVLATLKAARAQPRYASPQEVYADIGAALERRLAEDPAQRGALGRLQTVVAYELSGPDARITLVLRPPSARILCGSSEAQPDVVFQMTSKLAADYWRGRVDLAAAVRSGEIRVSGTVQGALAIASVLKRFQLDDDRMARCSP